jgi:hypothetical protein
MPDFYYLVPPHGGSVFNLGSWIQADPGPEFGDGAMAAHFAENPAADGGALAFESIGIRQFQFPLILASHSAWSGLQQLEVMLRLAARSGGAYVDLQPDGVATADMIRFDIAAGRWKPDYQIRHQAIDVRQGTLELDVQPFGYMPTTILLASAASVGLPGQLAIPNASIIGDVPGLVDLLISATGATDYGGGTPDGVLYSLAPRPSFIGFIPAASLTPQNVISAGGVAPTLTGDAFAPGSQAWQVKVDGNITEWNSRLQAIIPTALEPAYRGRHRLFVYARLSPSNGVWDNLTADAVPHPSAIGQNALNDLPLASAAPVATVIAAGASFTDLGAVASRYYHFIDLGEIVLPPSASGASAWPAIRLWNKPVASNIAVPTPLLSVAGLYLQPLEGPAAVVRNLYWPRTQWEAGAHFDISDRALVENQANTANARTADVLGQLPRVGASSVSLAVNYFDKGAASALPGRRRPAFAKVGISYRPRFAFVRGL